MDITSYVTMLQSGLESKLHILDRIIAENEKQLDVLKDPNALPEDLEKTIDIKSELIEELDALDDGFAELFDRVKEEMEGHKDQYKDQISTMQTLIRQITDRSAQIKAQEIRNKEHADDKFSYIKEQVKKVTKSRKAVNSYYNNMMKVNYVDPQFMDNKK